MALKPTVLAGYRALLREAFKFFDLQARCYLVHKVRHDFRRYANETCAVAVRKHLHTMRQRSSFLKRANAGAADDVKRVLALAYGRVGRIAHLPVASAVERAALVISGDCFRSRRAERYNARLPSPALHPLLFHMRLQRGAIADADEAVRSRKRRRAYGDMLADNVRPAFVGLSTVPGAAVFGALNEAGVADASQGRDRHRNRPGQENDSGVGVVVGDMRRSSSSEDDASSGKNSSSSDDGGRGIVKNRSSSDDRGRGSGKSSNGNDGRRGSGKSSSVDDGRRGSGSGEQRHWQARTDM